MPMGPVLDKIVVNTNFEIYQNVVDMCVDLAPINQPAL